MPNIDTLSIQFNANGTDKAVRNIKAMGESVKELAQSINSIDANKLTSFTSSMDTLKKSVPTNAQTNRMVAFGNAVKDLSSVIGSANISGFSKDMSTLGEAVQTFKRSSVNSITNAVTAIQSLGSQAQSTANVISNAIPKKSVDIKAGDNRATLSETKAVVESLERAGSRVDALKSKFKGIFVPTKQFKTLEEQADKVAQKYDKLRQKMQEALDSGKMTTGDETFRKQSAELDALRQQYNDLIQKQKELAQSGGGVVLNPTLKSSLQAFHSGFSKVTNIVKNGFVAGIRHANSAIKSFASHVKQSASSLKDTITGGHKATDMAKKFAKELLRVSKMLKLMVTRMALRAVIKEVGNGFKSLALHSDEFNNSMSNLINGSKKLGYSFAAMVAPLINALAPAIVYVINLLTKLINIIQQVFGALTGATTWNKAKDFTDSWADNIEAANKGAKELKKTVLGFDELNQLQDNKSSGGGGSNIADMFDTKDIEPKWKKFADWLKDMWKKGDFTDLGKAIGEWLLNALNSIPWSKIYRMAAKIGKSLSTLINGFVEVRELGYTIGKSLAKAINTAFYFLDDFVRNLHWKSIGQFIAETFNGFFENIKWNKIYSTVYYGVRGIADAIQSAIDTFHWDNISNTIINGIDVITTGITEFFGRVKWKNIGVAIGDQIQKSIKGIKWRKIGEALGTVLQSAIDFCSGLINKLNVKDVVKALTDLINGFFDKVDMAEAGRNIGKIMQNLIDIIKGFWKDNKERIKEELGRFIGGIFEELDKEDLAAILGAVLGGAVALGVGKMVLTAATTLMTEKIKEWLASAIGSKVVTSAAGKALGDAVGEAAGGTTVTGAATAAGASIGTTLFAGITAILAGHAAGNELGKILFPEDAELYEQYSGIFGFFTEIKDLATGVYDLIDLKLNGTIELSDEWKKKVEESKQKLDELREQADQTGSSLGKIYDTKAAEGLQGMKDRAEELKNSLVHIQDTKAAEKFAEWKHISNDAADSMNELTISVEKDNDSVVTATGTWGDFFKAFVKAKDWGEVVDAFKNIKGSVDKDTEALEALAKKSRETNAIKFTPLSDSVRETGDNFKIFDTKAAEALSNMKTNAIKTSDETKRSIGTVNTSLTDSVVVVEEYTTEWAGAQQDISATVQTLSLDTSKSMDDIKKNVSDSMTDVNKSLDTVKDGMSEDKWTFSGVASGLKKTFEDAKSGIKGIWNDIADTLNGEHTIFNSSFRINLPRFASGGFPRENGLFLANSSELVGKFSNGKTAVANNEQITQGIAQAVYNAIVSAQSSNSGQYINNTIMLDGDVLARAVTKGQDRLNRRYSPTSV